jgi:uncharacterized protein YndB with AHSA1/START domain
MPHISLNAHFDAPIERVFELGTDFKRYPEWNVTYREIKEIAPEPVRVGTRIHLAATTLGQTREGWDEVVEFDPPRLLKVTGTRGDQTKVTIIDRATPVPNGTDMVIEVEYELGRDILSKVTDKLFVEKAIERDLKHSLENFKALVEAPVPVLA